jgi:Protein of unknown function (DUF3276)
VSFFKRERDPRDNNSQNDRSGGFNRSSNSGGGRFESRDRAPREPRSNSSFDREREESAFEKKVRAGKRRTYFFDVRKTKGEDYFLTITESTKRFDGSYERHKIFLYKEDFNRFQGALDEVLTKVKTEFMPEFDYDEYDRRQREWEEKQAQLALEGEEGGDTEEEADDAAEVVPSVKAEVVVPKQEVAEVKAPAQDTQVIETDLGRVEVKRAEIDDDMAW